MALPSGAGDLTQVDTVEGAGEEGISSKDLAAQVLARSSTNPTPADESGITHQGVQDDGTQIVIDPEKPADSVTVDTTETAGVQTEEVPLAQIEAALAEAGIDLGIAGKDLPKEMLPAYEKLVQSAVDLAQQALSKELEASQAIQSVNRFSERLKTAPDKVLLALAMNQPEVWKKVAGLVAEMEQDPRVRQMVERDLESEARLMEAERKEQAMQEQYRRTKANQVIAHTTRLAREHGVPYGMAEKMVAMAVTANQGDIELSEVNQIVADLAKDMGRTPPVKQQKVATPAKVAAAKGVPTQPVGGSATTATPARDPDVSAGLKDGSSERQGGGGQFRGLIKSINARIRAI
jgi:hypothetical protein